MASPSVADPGPRNSPRPGRKSRLRRLSRCGPLVWMRPVRDACVWTALHRALVRAPGPLGGSPRGSAHGQPRARPTTSTCTRRPGSSHMAPCPANRIAATRITTTHTAWRCLPPGDPREAGGAAPRSALFVADLVAAGPGTLLASTGHHPSPRQRRGDALPGSGSVEPAGSGTGIPPSGHRP